MSVRLKPILHCPWCHSYKIMCEGTDKRIAMICQGCLAKGPEVEASAGRDYALAQWNERNRGRFSRIECPTCQKTVRVSACGIWPHYHARKHQAQCESSNQPHEIQTA